MGNLGSGELLVIFFVALLVLGPNKLPEAARQVGRAVNEIRRISGGFQREMREAMQEPLKAAEQAKADMIDPFSSAASSAANTIKNPLGDVDPPLPSAGGTAEAAQAAEDAAATPPSTPEPEAEASGPESRPHIELSGDDHGTTGDPEPDDGETSAS
ncbi:MAG: twin-arginine translocase TatA/TatE family subunit [Actinomycetota bacterium]